MTRSYLFLQGVCSPFFSRLGERLRAGGAAVSKVNFTAGDAAYWRNGEARAFRGRAQALPAFYAAAFAERGATDIVLFGDRRPVHRPAIELARREGLRVHVFEEGYFRPHWITLERGGVNAHSALPRVPAWYREAARRAGPAPEPRPFRAPFWNRAGHDVAYHLCGALNAVCFPRYRSHAPYGAAREYAAYVRRAAALRWRGQTDAMAVARVASGSRPYYLLPLQLEGDAQIRDHSPFHGMRQVAALAIASFARHAPEGSLLVVKNHPLDPGVARHETGVRELARTYGVADRVVYLERGHLPSLLARAAGVVTVNSTVGAAALEHGCPTMALSSAIYHLEGLTFQGTLDEFWRAAEPPDGSLFRDFKAAVVHATQVNGGFYSEPGISLAVDSAAERIARPRSPLEEML